MKLSEVIPEVIRLAEAASEYWERELPKRFRDYPLVHPGEEEGPPPPEEVELRKLLMELPKDMFYKLFLIVDLGQGYSDMGNLAGRFEELKEMFPKREGAVSLMVEGALADNLTDGLAKLRENKIDVDQLLPKRARPRK